MSSQSANSASTLNQNIAANDAYVKKEYPGEKFIETTSELQSVNKYTSRLKLPENTKIAELRATIKSNEQQRTLRKELWQSGILSCRGNSVYLTPEITGYKQKVTDALVNGVPFEFRNVDSKVRKIETRFGDAKKKGNDVNVYMNIDAEVSVSEVRRRIGLVLDRHPEYSGKIIVSINGNNPYFWDTKSFR